MCYSLASDTFGTVTRASVALSSTLPLAIVALAFVARAYGLNTQGLWYDEAFSVHLARRDLLSLLAGVSEDNHAPLHTVLLHFWIALAGWSETAVRFPSALAGTAVVAMTYAVGRRFFGAPVGLSAALIMAVSPIEVWYSQEARMYSLGTAFSLFSAWCFLEWLRSRLLASIPNTEGIAAVSKGPPWLLGVVLAGVLGLYTHFYVGLVLLAENIVVVLACAARLVRRSSLRWTTVYTWTLAQAAVLAFISPWLPVVANRLQHDTTYWQGQLDVPRALAALSVDFAGGQYLPPPGPGIIALVAAALFAAASLPVRAPGVHMVLQTACEEGARARPPGRAESAASLPPPGDADRPAGDQASHDGWAGRYGATEVCYAKSSVQHPVTVTRSGSIPGYARIGLMAMVIAPVAAVVLLSLDRPKFSTRYMIFVQPLYALAVAVGAMVVARASRGIATRAVGGLAIGAILAGSAWSVLAYHTDPSLWRDDFRAVARYVREHFQEGDAVALVGGHSIVPWWYYDPAPMDAYPIPDGLVPVVGSALDPQVLADRLNSIAETHQRLWLVSWQSQLVDPQNLVVDMLRSRATEISVDTLFRGVKLRLFSLRPRPVFSAEPDVPVRLDLVFEDRIELVGYELETGYQYEPSDQLRLNLFWRGLRPMDEKYTVFMHLLNEAEMVYVQQDKPPVTELLPTSVWRPGEVHKDRYRLFIPPGTPPGRYYLELGLYRRESGRRLSISVPYTLAGQDRYLLPIEMLPGRTFAPDEIRVQYPARETLAGETLLFLGHEYDGEPLRAGHRPVVALVWRALRQPPEHYRLRLELQDAGGRVVAGAVQEFANGLHPPEHWQADETVRSVHPVWLDASIPPGRYHWRLTVLDSSGEDRGSIRLLPDVEVAR